MTFTSAPPTRCPHRPYWPLNKPRHNHQTRQKPALLSFTGVDLQYVRHYRRLSCATICTPPSCPWCVSQGVRSAHGEEGPPRCCIMDRRDSIKSSSCRLETQKFAREMRLLLRSSQHPCTWKKPTTSCCRNLSTNIPTHG